VVGPARLPGHLRGTPARRGPADPDKPGPSPDGGASSGEGAAGTGTGPADSVDIDSGPLAASSLDLTGVWKEGFPERGG